MGEKSSVLIVLEWKSVASKGAKQDRFWFCTALSLGSIFVTLTLNHMQEEIF